MVCTSCGTGQTYSHVEATTGMIRNILTEAANLTLNVTGTGTNAKINVRKGVSAITRVQLLERMMGLGDVYSKGMWTNMLNGPKSRRSLQIGLGKSLTGNQLFVATALAGNEVFIKDVVVVGLMDATARAVRQ